MEHGWISKTFNVVHQGVSGHMEISQHAVLRDRVAVRMDHCIKSVKFRSITIRISCQYVCYLHYSENLNWAAQNLNPLLPPPGKNPSDAHASKLLPARITYCWIPNLLLLAGFAESDMIKNRAMKQLRET